MNKGIILLTRCCGRGFSQCVKLVKALTERGLVYDMHQVTPRQAKEICQRFDIEKRTKTPWIYIEDLCFPAASINDDVFFNKLLDDLQRIKDAEQKD